MTLGPKSRRLVAISALALCAAVPRSASAQSTHTADSINNEYRVTLVATRPAAEREKVIFFGYLGGVSSPDKKVASFYYSPPGLIIKPKPWAESLPRRGQRVSVLPDFDE